MTASGQLLIGDVIRKNAAAVPDRVAAWLAGDSLSHAELDDLGDRIAWQLRDAGVERGDRILTWTDTSLDVLPLFVAAARLGAVFAPLNARHNADEAAPIAASARAKLLVADRERLADAPKIAESAGIPLVAAIGRGLPDGASGPIDLRLDLHLDLDALPASRGAVEAPGLEERDPHVIFFTSGSTGKPKGVVLSHRANYLRTYQGVFLAEPERSVCMFPLFHMAAFTLALAAWQTQGEIAFVPVATADEILAAVEQRRANRLYCIPAVWKRILETDPERFDTSSLRYIDTGTSATPVELMQALRERYPDSTLRIFYGATETGAGTMLWDSEVLTKPGSVGRPSPGVELRLGESGEICLRNPFLMDGYFENPEATAEALRDGWYHTGDLGALDDEGYLSVVGRAKEIIRTGGESVAPVEIEPALASHPSIAEVAVVGIPDADWGEVVCAVVILREGSDLSLAELQRHCEGQLANFKKPRRLEIVDALPRTAATAQVQRALLVEQILLRTPSGSGG